MVMPREPGRCRSPRCGDGKLEGVVYRVIGSTARCDGRSTCRVHGGARRVPLQVATSDGDGDGDGNGDGC